jgi:Asp-tRNA(Asn)/Glu-tRNA(Gln) amidotransferase A subunit family amidase
MHAIADFNQHSAPDLPRLIRDKSISLVVTLASLPAASVPCGQTTAGLPVGLQIVGPRFGELNMLRAAKLVESINPISGPRIVEAMSAG